MSTTKEASPRSCNSGELQAQTPTQRNSSKSNNTINAPLYKIIDEPFYHIYPVEAGANSNLIIEQAIRVLKTVKASGFPIPVAIDIKEPKGETTVLCGKKFSIEKTITGAFAASLRHAMCDTGVNYCSILAVGDYHCPIVTFGRSGKPEFIAYIAEGV